MKKQLNKQTIGVGVVGTGYIGPAHIEGLRRNGIQVLSLMGSTKEKTEKKAIELGIRHVYVSLDDMLADPEIDVVHLATPNHLHHIHAKAALLAGKHVVCEKPLAMNTTESAELVKLAKENNLVNAVNYNLRMYPLVHQARSMVQNGELGDLFIFKDRIFKTGYCSQPIGIGASNQTLAAHCAPLATLALTGSTC